jgi:hypothetical protein
MNPDPNVSLTRAESRRAYPAALLCMALLLAALPFLLVAPGLRAATDDDTVIAMDLAELLRASRTVVSRNQELINDPAKGDKGLTGEKVLADAIALYRETTGKDPSATDPETREGRLLRAQMQAIRDVVEENQDTINAEGVAFKGFIPAVFARLVNEKFDALVGDEAQVKVTAPEALVRNRKARPDAWEIGIIEGKFEHPDWPEGQPFSETLERDGKPAFRMIVPEYYAASCLACHGEPAGEVDITGYPKEGGKEGDLGAAISITLFK